MALYEVRDNPRGENKKNENKVFIHIGFNGFGVKEVFEAEVNSAIPRNIVERFLSLMPFVASSPFHTVSSGENLSFSVPDPKLDNYLSTTHGSNLQSRSRSAPGSVFLRNSQRASILYGKSEDHGVYLPCIMRINKSDVARFQNACRKFWEMQLFSSSKLVLALDFSFSRAPMPIPSPVFPGIETKNSDLRDAINYIFQNTSQIWTHPPTELVDFLRFGDSARVEGTNGHVFPMQTIVASLGMLFSNFAHSSPVHFIHELLRDCTEESIADRIAVIGSFFERFFQENINYLRCVNIGPLVSVCDAYIRGLKSAGSYSELKTLTDAFVLFGARMHGWMLYFYPYHVGSHLRYDNPQSFFPEGAPLDTKGVGSLLSPQQRYEFYRYGVLHPDNIHCHVSGEFSTRPEINQCYLITCEPHAESQIARRRLVDIFNILLGPQCQEPALEKVSIGNGVFWHQSASYREISGPNSLTIVMALENSVEVDFYPQTHLLGGCYEHLPGDLEPIKRRLSPQAASHLEKFSAPTSIVLAPGRLLIINDLTVFRIRPQSTTEHASVIMVNAEEISEFESEAVESTAPAYL